MRITPFSTREVAHSHLKVNAISANWIDSLVYALHAIVMGCGLLQKAWCMRTRGAENAISSPPHTFRKNTQGSWLSILATFMPLCVFGEPSILMDGSTFT